VATRRLAQIGVGVLVLAGIGVGAFFGIRALSDDEDTAPAPPVAVERDDEEARAPEELGFPAFATKNTTRVGGNDATANAAGAALATFPSTGGVESPAAVTLVPSSDWAAALAASVLAAEPVSAPVLISDRDEVPEQTATAIEAMSPEGSADTSEAEAFRIGDVEAPAGTRTIEVPAADPAQTADAVDRLRERLTDREPRNIVVVSTEDPGFAMPAAAWAARSGDPVLVVERDRVPEATLRALKRHKQTPVFLLGPESVASDKVVRELEKEATAVQRVSGGDPVANSIAFARFDAGTFGWNVADPGHGLVIANASRPLDAAAAAPLSAAGKWGPLLVTDDADSVPVPLRGYLLDIKPGYRSDPTRAFYNHAWLIGNNSALSVAFQAQVDELLELIQIQPAPGTTEGEPEREPR
jgi:hypothetical protein